MKGNHVIRDLAASTQHEVLDAQTPGPTDIPLHRHTVTGQTLLLLSIQAVSTFGLLCMRLLQTRSSFWSTPRGGTAGAVWLFDAGLLEEPPPCFRRCSCHLTSHQRCMKVPAKILLNIATLWKNKFLK